LNFIISFFLFLLFAGELKKELYLLFTDYSILKEKVFANIGLLSPFVSGISWLFYLIICFLSLGFFILLILRKEKSRIFFIRMLPFLWVINSIHMYKYLVGNNEFKNIDNLMSIILIIDGVFAILIYMFYSSRFVKKFFQIRSEMG
jgi:hypothetical protein